MIRFEDLSKNSSSGYHKEKEDMWCEDDGIEKVSDWKGDEEVRWYDDSKILEGG